MGSMPGPGRSPGGGAWQPSLVLLPGESHGQTSLAGYSQQVTKGRTRLKRLSLAQHSATVYTVIGGTGYRFL